MITNRIRDFYDRAMVVCGEEFTRRRDLEVEAAPGEVREAAELLRLCNAERIPVSIHGNGSKQEWLTGGGADLRLCTTRMTRMMEHVWQDMTCTVQAGCSWQSMQETLAHHGQMVALDPLWPGRATVGGVVATNDSGALRLRYGGLRDLLIGMTIVLADGTVARSGGKVVKNVAGYDLPKLLCGSFGTLACIAEVTFRLHAIARHTVTITASGPDAESLGKLLLRMLDSQLSLHAMQLRTEDEGFALDMRLAALPDVLAAQSERVFAATASPGIRTTHTGDEVWLKREALFDTGNDAILFKATMLPTQIAAAVESVAECGGSAVAQAHGILTGSVPVASAERLTALRARLDAEGGSVVLLRVPATVALDRWSRLPGSMPLMRSVKQQFDPNAILNAGRFLGGL